MKRTSLGLKRGTTLSLSGGMDKAVILRNHRKGVSIEIRIEASDVPEIRAWLGEVYHEWVEAILRAQGDSDKGEKA